MSSCPSDFAEPKPITIALIDGKEVEYGAASNTGDYYSLNQWEYLGQGTIYSVGGGNSAGNRPQRIASFLEA